MNIEDGYLEGAGGGISHGSGDGINYGDGLGNGFTGV